MRAAFEPGGTTYLNAYRPVGNPPLLLAVSLSERETLSAWWLQAVVAFTLVAGFLVLLLSAERAITRAIEARAAADRRDRAQADQLATAMKQRAEADAALRANQAQFQSVMQHAPMMVSLKDLEGRYTFVNEAFQKFTGRGADIVLGKTAADLNAKEFADFIAGEDRSAVESRRVIQREITTPPEHGARTTLLVKFPVFDEHGESTGVGTVMTDITEQKQDRGAARPDAADRSARPAHRRHRARLQQPADLDPAQRRRADRACSTTSCVRSPRPCAWRPSAAPI